jgi:hypothetical protein
VSVLGWAVQGPPGGLARQAPRERVEARG